MSDYRCSKCARVLEHIGVPAHIRMAQMYGQVVNVGSEQVPDEIKSDPYVYRGFYCRACGGVFCPSCNNMQSEVCAGCGSRQLMPAYRPLLKRLAAHAAATSATPQPASSSTRARFDESTTVPDGQGIYLTVLKKYAVFGGRARRKEFWVFFLLQVIILIALLTLSVNVSGPLGILALIYFSATIVPTISVQVRRLHDTGRSGWWSFINVVPFIGAIVILVFMAQDSQPTGNRYGPNPGAEVAKPGRP